VAEATIPVLDRQEEKPLRLTCAGCSGDRWIVHIFENDVCQTCKSGISLTCPICDEWACATCTANGDPPDA
jgi:hypothetical protein